MPEGRTWETHEPSPSELWRMIQANREEFTRRQNLIDQRIDNTLVNREYYLARHDALRATVEAQHEAVLEDIADLRRTNHDRIVFNRAIIVALTTVFCGFLVNLALILVHLH